MDAILAVVKGVLIGIANIIPGVSGGTLALMLGIYKRVIDALAHVNGEFLRKAFALVFFRRGAWRTLWSYVADSDLWFLGWLGAGAAGAILLASRLMAWLLETHHAASYAFFFGLVLCSIVFPWRCLTRRSWREAVSLLLAAVLTVGLSLSVTDTEKIEKAERKLVIAAAKAAAATGEAADAVSPDVDYGRLGYIFLAAVLAISAMVLPGVSGSFVLLLMGVYFDILGAINNRDFVVLGVFALGAAGGLLAFSRLMGLLLARCFNVTMAFMTGLMLGSLYELWPFKRVAQVGAETLYLSAVWRWSTPGEGLAALVALVVGAVIVIGFAIAGRGREQEDWHSVLKR
jgi:putative membrane protein